MKLDEVVAAVIKLRDKIEAVKQGHKEQLAPLNIQMEKLEAYLHLQIQKMGVTSFAAKGVGTAYLQNVVSTKVEDWQALLEWIRANEGWEFLEKRVSKSVVESYVESHKATPPGVTISTDVEVRVRRG